MKVYFIENLARNVALYKLGSAYHSGMRSRGYRVLSKASRNIKRLGITDPSTVGNRKLSSTNFRKNVAKYLKKYKRFRKSM